MREVAVGASPRLVRICVLGEFVGGNLNRSLTENGQKEEEEALDVLGHGKGSPEYGMRLDKRA
jgi:hypothetical protein